jgi:hypothetical protein
VPSSAWSKTVFNGHLLEHLLAYVAFSTPRKKMFFVSDALKTVFDLASWYLLATFLLVYYLCTRRPKVTAHLPH